MSTGFGVVNRDVRRDHDRAGLPPPGRFPVSVYWKSTAAAIMDITGVSRREIAEHLGISVSGVSQLLQHAGEPRRTRRRAGVREVPDDPRWHMARAAIGYASTNEEMSAIWTEYQDVWTEDLTNHGKAVLRGIKWDEFLNHMGRKRCGPENFARLALAHKYGKLRWIE